MRHERVYICDTKKWYERTVNEVRMPSLQLIVFLTACVIAILSRLVPKSVSRKSKQKMYKIKVLFQVASGEDWNGIIWEHLQSALNPRQLCFGVLVECSRVSDTEIEIDPLLRSFTSVEYVQRRKTSYVKRARRLCKHFVIGDETLIIIIDQRVRFCVSFDLELTGVLSEISNEMLVSMPCRSTNGRGHFPCLTKTGRASLPFRVDEHRLSPIVCPCYEALIARPQTLSKSSAFDSLQYMGPTTALLIDNWELERCYEKYEESKKDACASVGIVDFQNEDECVMKFGAFHTASLAVKFGYESVAR